MSENTDGNRRNRNNAKDKKLHSNKEREGEKKKEEIHAFTRTKVYIHDGKKKETPTGQHIHAGRTDTD